HPVLAHAAVVIESCGDFFVAPWGVARDLSGAVAGLVLHPLAVQTEFHPRRPQLTLHVRGGGDRFGCSRLGGGRLGGGRPVCLGGGRPVCLGGGRPVCLGGGRVGGVR